MNADGPLPICHLHHVARTTRDTAKAIAFYCNVLGFRELERPGFSFGGAWLHNYGLQIHIIESTAPAPAAPDAIDSRSNHIAFEVKEYESVLAKLDAWSIPYREQVNAGGIRQIFFLDPDGHHIELAMYPPNPPYASP